MSEPCYKRTFVLESGDKFGIISSQQNETDALRSTAVGVSELTGVATMDNFNPTNGNGQDSPRTIPNFSHWAYQQIRHELKHYDALHPEATQDDRFRFFWLLNESEKRHKPNLFKPGYVYLMYDYMKDVYKIGQSISPKQRRDQLDPTLEIVCQIKTGSMRQLESSLHSLFISKRIKRGNQLEWFALDPADVQFIMSLQGNE